MTPTDELESLRSYIEERWPCIDPSVAWELRCRIRKAIEDAGLEIRQFAQRHDYGSETARFLAKKHSDLYHITPRDERLTRMGVALERITETELELLRKLRDNSSETWTATYETHADVAYAIGPAHGKSDSGPLFEDLASWDASFMEAAHHYMPALLHELRRAREALRDLVEALGKDDLPRREAIAKARWQLMQWEPDSTEDAP